MALRNPMQVNLYKSVWALNRNIQNFLESEEPDPFLFRGLSAIYQLCANKMQDMYYAFMNPDVDPDEEDIFRGYEQFFLIYSQLKKCGWNVGTLEATIAQGKQSCETFAAFDAEFTRRKEEIMLEFDREIAEIATTQLQLTAEEKNFPYYRPLGPVYSRLSTTARLTTGTLSVALQLKNNGIHYHYHTSDGKLEEGQITASDLKQALPNSLDEKTIIALREKFAETLLKHNQEKFEASINQYQKAVQALQIRANTKIAQLLQSPHYNKKHEKEMRENPVTFYAMVRAKLNEPKEERTLRKTLESLAKDEAIAAKENGGRIPEKIQRKLQHMRTCAQRQFDESQKKREFLEKEAELMVKYYRR